MSRRPLLGVERLSLRERFWAKAKKTSDGACWEWGAAKNSNGYGRIKAGGYVWLAHRLAWTLERGFIPEGYCVLHRCDNPACVNLAHLRLGVQADNVAEMNARGRGSRPPRFEGEGHPEAKLTAASAARIRALYQAGGYSQLALAKLFLVSETTVGDIVRGKRW